MIMMLGSQNLLDLGEDKAVVTCRGYEFTIICRYYADHLKFLNRRQCKDELKEKARKASKLKEELWGAAKEFERVMLQKHINR